MNLLFYHTENLGEIPLVNALVNGAQLHGMICQTRQIEEYGQNQRLDDQDILHADAVFVCRTSPYAKRVMEACVRLGVNYIYCDKGYLNRGWKSDNPDIYYRFSVNNFQPLDYFQSIPRPSDRWDKLKIPLKKPQGGGKHIVFAGCSWKFGLWNGFEITEYATQVVQQIKKYTDRPIIYRPKVSSKKPPEIPGTLFSYDEKRIAEDLESAHALVTFSSNAASDAIFAGIPAFVLGPAIAKPVSNTDLSKINEPYFPDEHTRKQWCYDLAYCQWRVEEMMNGMVWEYLREVLAGQKKSLNLKK